MKKYLIQIKMCSDERRGRGVFATKFIGEGTEIEVADLYTFHHDSNVKKTGIDPYVYWFPNPEGDREMGALGSGCAEFYNHSQKPNAQFFIDACCRKITYVALKDIHKGDEITIDYDMKLSFEELQGE